METFTGRLWGESSRHRWIPLAKDSNAWFDVLSDVRLNKWLNKQSTLPAIWDAMTLMWRHCDEFGYIGTLVVILVWVICIFCEIGYCNEVEWRIYATVNGVIIGQCHDISPVRHSTWINAYSLSTEPSETNFIKKKYTPLHPPLPVPSYWIRVACTHARCGRLFHTPRSVIFIRGHLGRETD